MIKMGSLEPELVLIVDGANFLLLNIVDHLPELLIGATLAGQVSLGPAPQHIPRRRHHLLNLLDGGVDSQHLHLLVHLPLRTTILDLLLVLLLVDGRIGSLEVGLVEADIVIDGPILQTAELLLQTEIYHW